MAQYITTAQLYRLIGQKRAEQIADHDGSGDADAIASTITAAIEDASDYVDDSLRQSNYQIPLQGTEGDLGYLKRIVAMIAFYQLYQGRGLRETDGLATRAANGFEEANRYLAEVRAGQIVPPLVTRRAGKRAPAITTPYTSRISRRNLQGGVG